MKPLKVTETFWNNSVPPWDPVARSHLWVILCAYRFSGNPEGSTPLDETTLVEAAGPGCYYCEWTWEPSRVNTLCPGNLTG